MSDEKKEPQRGAPPQPAPTGVEHVHRVTEPGEPVAPEIVAGGDVHHEPGAHTQADDIDMSVLVLGGVFFAVTLFAVVVLLQAWFYSWSAAERERKTEPDPALRSLLASQVRRLHPPGGITFDPTTNAYRISIDKAMQLEVARAGQSQAHDVPVEPR